jgi:hypothetical protein
MVSDTMGPVWENAISVQMVSRSNKMVLTVLTNALVDMPLLTSTLLDAARNAKVAKSGRLNPMQW